MRETISTTLPKDILEKIREDGYAYNELLILGYFVVKMLGKERLENLLKET